MEVFMNRKFIIFLVFLVFISIANVSAIDDVNQSDLNLNFDKSDSEGSFIAIQEESLSDINDVNQTDSDSNFDRLDSECCSFVIQEENETVFAFRQDSALNGRGVVIHNKSLGDMEVIVQEIDSPANHFIHAIITEDGWIASHGGDSSNVSDTIALENIAFEMLLTKNITQDGLGQIRDIFHKPVYGDYGHFLIKAPDGRYGIAYGETCIFGTLKPGEFLVIPNIYPSFRKGNYNDYSMNPVDAIIDICSYEDTGFNRRNLYSYDYKAHDTSKGQKYGVDIYVTNDNGHNVGLNTSKIVTYCYFNDARYSQAEIPQNPDKLYITTHIFENQPVNSTFEVVRSPNIAYIDRYTPIYFKINNIVDERTVVFDLDGENVEFINAVVFQGNYSIDSTQHKLYWDLPATNSSKEIILSVYAKAKGHYKIRGHVEGIDEEMEVSAYATNEAAILKAENVTTYKTYFKSMKVYLTDEDGVPLIGERVSITINGSSYYRKVTPDGYAAFSIMLQPGEYDAFIYYGTDWFDAETSSKIIVKKTLFSDNLIVPRGNASTFDVYCLDENGTVLAENSEIDFYMDGVIRSRYVDDEGICSLNLNKLKLDNGNHSITSYNVRTNEFVTNWIYVAEICTQDLVKIYKNDSKFEAKIGVANETVTFEINGKNYTRISNENGTASMAINLGPGDYTIKTSYNNFTVENNITVLPTLIAENLVKYYKNASQFYIDLIDSEGNPVADVNITMNINGVFYNRTTNENGTARLNINLPPGKYILTATDPLTGLQMSYNITVLPTLNAADLEMTYKDGSTFNVTVLDGQGNPLSNAKVTFNINGVFYNKISDSNGIAKLNINLMAGEYIITSEYDGLKTANTIIIKG